LPQQTNNQPICCQGFSTETRKLGSKVRLRIKLCACTDFPSQMALSKWSPWHKADSQLLTGFEYAVLLGVSYPQ
jgi:hypothetical protein